MLSDKKQSIYDRLHAKDLDHQFMARLERGMGCTPFVSEAITKLVRAVYFPILDSPWNIKPGQLIFTCLSASNGASAAIKTAQQISAVLTVDAGAEDLTVRQKNGVEALRRHRICRVCAEAYSQGGLLTIEDMAYRLFNVGERTIIRDLSVLRSQNESPPLRSTIKDIGRTVTHRNVLIKNWLNGDELSDLHRKYSHSIGAVENYINTFKRVVILYHEGYKMEQIAYMLKVSPALARTHYALWKEHKSRALPHRKREMEDALTIIPLKKIAIKRKAAS